MKIVPLLLAPLLGLLLPLATQASEATMDSLLAKLEASHWVAEGPQQPERVAYVFTDMACPYCATLWQSMQPMVNDPANTLQVRHIIVGLIHPKRSFTQGAAVLAAINPAVALARHESQFKQGGIPPLEPVPAAVRSQIHNNTGLMIGLGLGATPTLVFQDPEGRWRVAPGVLGDEDLREAVFQIN